MPPLGERSRNRRSARPPLSPTQAKVHSNRAARREDVYALSFWAYPEDDDPRRQVLDFSYNTVAQADTSAAYASDPGEAKWNYAYWLQNSLALICDAEDSVGARARQSWLNSLRLHSEGVVLAKFGRGLPILIHNQEYDARVLEATRKANPDGACADFEAWLMTSLKRN